MKQQGHMKKIIKLNESQLINLISEIYKQNRIRRRLSDNFTEENVIERIEKEMGETDPNDYWDEFEYASNIISWVVDYFYPNNDDDPRYDDIYEDIHTFMKEEYGSMIFDFYYDNIDYDNIDDEDNEEEGDEEELTEKWSDKYKRSINCNNPKGFSQKAHCAGRRKKSETKEGEINEKCWKGYTQKGMKTMFGKRYPNCVKKTK